MTQVLHWKVLKQEDGWTKVLSKNQQHLPEIVISYGTSTELDVTDTTLRIFQIELSNGEKTLYRSFVCFGKHPNIDDPRMLSFVYEMNKELSDEMSHLYPKKAGSFANMVTHQKRTFKFKNSFHDFKVDFYKRKTLLLWMNQLAEWNYCRKKIFGTDKWLEYYTGPSKSTVEIGNIFYIQKTSAKSFMMDIQIMMNHLPAYQIYGTVKSRYKFNNDGDMYTALDVSFFWISQPKKTEITPKRIKHLAASIMFYYWKILDESNIRITVAIEMMEFILTFINEIDIWNIIRMFGPSIKIITDAYQTKNPVVFFQRKPQLIEQKLHITNEAELIEKHAYLKDGTGNKEEIDKKNAPIDGLVKSNKRLILVNDFC